MPREVIGIDPGYVNYAICKLRFTGLQYDPVHRIETPLFTVQNLEIWDLSASCIIRHTESTGGEARLDKVGESPSGKTCLRDWLNKLNEFIDAADWIHTKDSETGKLPRVTVENQCGHIKNGDYTMFKIAKATEAYIKRHDKKEKGRIIGKSARKYGIKSDGKLAYGGRKSTSVDVVRSLFTASKLDNWITYLDSLLRYGQKIDDLCDAILLALQVAINEHEEATKTKKKLNYSQLDKKTYPILLSVVNTATGKEEYNHEEPKRKRLGDDPNPSPVKRKKALPREAPLKRKRTPRESEPVKRAKLV